MFLDYLLGRRRVLPAPSRNNSWSFFRVSQLPHHVHECRWKLRRVGAQREASRQPMTPGTTSRTIIS